MILGFITSRWFSCCKISARCHWSATGGAAPPFRLRTARGHTLVSELSFSTNLFDFGSTTSSLTVKCGIRWIETVSETSFWISWKVQPSESGRDSSSSQISAQLWLDRRLDQVRLEEGTRRHVVLETVRQMLQDRFDRVARLLAGDAQILLQRARHRREDCLGRFLRVEWNGGRGRPTTITLLIMLLLLRGGRLLHALDVRERFLGRGDQPGAALFHPPLVLVLLVEALVVGGIAATGVGRQHGARLALLLGRRRPVHVVVLEGGDGGRLPLRFRDGQPLQVRVVDAELGVVPLQHPHGRPLDAELPDAVAVRLAVRTADHLHVVERLQVADFEQHHRHVMHEQQRVAEAGGVRDQRSVVDHGRAGHDRPGALGHLHDVEQPVGEGGDQHQQQGARAEQKDARHDGGRLAEKQCPQPDREQQQPGGQRHQHALALRIAGQQPQPLVLRQVQAFERGRKEADARQHDHGQRAHERDRAQHHRQPPLEVALAGEADPPVVRHLEVADVLHRDALLGRVARDGGRVVAPRLVLRQDRHLDDLLPVPPLVGQY
uniref:Uncharacterized protein n=1 Tax=Anopheles merus TaxID=30066 RepID=A0A182V3C3_ANOME